jgi:hypothetical protein
LRERDIYPILKDSSNFLVLNPEPIVLTYGTHGRARNVLSNRIKKKGHGGIT